MKSDDQSQAVGDAETVYQRLFLFGDWKTDELFGGRSSMEFSGYDSKMAIPKEELLTLESVWSLILKDWQTL